MIDGNRHTGRTTRMIQEVIKVQQMGLPIAVVGANEREVAQLRTLFMELGGHLINFGFYSIYNYEEKLKGAPENIVIFIDHHATETLASEAEISKEKVKIMQKAIENATADLCRIKYMKVT